jgi:UDP-N-acetylmuramate dehydrogenase
VSSIKYTDLDEKSLSIHSISSSDCAFGYKKSLFQGKNWVILGADIEIPEYLSNTPHIIKNIFEKMKRKALLFSDLKNYYTFFHSVTSAIKGIEKNPLIKEIEIYRAGKKHFKYPSCGSVFKNNRALGAPAGYIIDRLGLKGFSHGGAMVSPHHGNIIINYKKARAADVIYLIDYISDQIYKNHGIMPEKEVIILQ